MSLKICLSEVHIAFTYKAHCNPYFVMSLLQVEEPGPNSVQIEVSTLGIFGLLKDF